VLGRTGKNFAAGMSGGIAYVLDEKGDFSTKLCNRSMVDIDPLDTKDEEKIWILIEKHFKLTDSLRAKMILDQWQQIKKKFVKVFPHDYKRVLGLKVNQKAPEKIKSVAVMEEYNG
jgi:glutamate synthase domain-containing protein 3